ncbi:hypothetical protein NX059_000705 [Plenodomus lindquistii]|nr:hypothetical protein NX059_000705 [Plenodomus lindquistii]
MGQDRKPARGSFERIFGVFRRKSVSVSHSRIKREPLSPPDRCQTSTQCIKKETPISPLLHKATSKTFKKTKSSFARDPSKLLGKYEDGMVKLEDIPSEESDCAPSFKSFKKPTSGPQLGKRKRSASIESFLTDESAVSQASQDSYVPESEASYSCTSSESSLRSTSSRDSIMEAPPYVQPETETRDRRGRKLVSRTNEKTANGHVKRARQSKVRKPSRKKDRNDHARDASHRLSHKEIKKKSKIASGTKGTKNKYL